MARQCAKDLPSDIHEDVVQETFVLLLKPHLARFDTTRGTVQAYLVGLVWNATKRVRASYGRRFPVCKKDDASSVSKPRLVPLDEAPQKFQVEDPVPTLHDNIAAHQVFEKAPPILRLVFERVYFADEPQTRVAAYLGIDRFMLRRQVAAFAQQFTAIQCYV